MESGSSCDNGVWILVALSYYNVCVLNIRAERERKNDHSRAESGRFSFYCTAAAQCPMLLAFWTKGPAMYGRSLLSCAAERSRARNFRSADRSSAVRQFYCMRSDDAVRPPLLYCEEIRCSSAIFCSAAEWSDAIWTCTRRIRRCSGSLSALLG